MEDKRIETPQYLVTRQRGPSLDGISFQRVQYYQGHFGATLDAEGTPIFFSCAELLGLLTILEQHRGWLEEHARYMVDDGVDN